MVALLHSYRSKATMLRTPASPGTGTAAQPPRCNPVRSRSAPAVP
jgi:hypothetical protein